MNWDLKREVLLKYGSQLEFAIHIRISENRLSRIIRGRTLPRPEERVKIAEALQVKEVELWPDIAVDN
jgi:transcriptional regulator with XRE-family HTH domain